MARASPKDTGVALGGQGLWYKDGGTSPCTQPLCPSEDPELRFKNLPAAPEPGHLLQQQHRGDREKHPKLSRSQNQREHDPVWSNT